MSLARQRLTPQDYLSLERKAELRSEYFDGRVYAMAGANQRHNLLASNVSGEFRFQFKGRPCKVFSSDMRVKVSSTGLYTYPDVVAFCEDARFEDEKEDTLLNPAVIVEVLSASTEAYDRGEKFGHYRRIESLSSYILISQDRIRVEHFERQPGGRWLLTELIEIQDSVDLSCIGCRLPLTEIYDKVEIPTGSEQGPRHP